MIVPALMIFVCVISIKACWWFLNMQPGFFTVRQWFHPSIVS